MTLVRLKPAAPQSRGKHSTTDSLRSQHVVELLKKLPINVNAVISSLARGLNFSLNIHLHPHFLYIHESSYGSGECSQCVDSLEPSLLLTELYNELNTKAGL